MKLTIREPMFFSYLDEKSFFAWLKQLDAVEKYEGSAIGLELLIREPAEKLALLDLVAWLTRYGIDMKPLRALCTPENEEWFRRPGSYWHKSIFVDS